MNNLSAYRKLADFFNVVFFFEWGVDLLYDQRRSSRIIFFQHFFHVEIELSPEALSRRIHQKSETRFR